MLHLHSPTEANWIARALAAIPEILLDHAHCEKKAASTAMSMIFKYPDHPSLVLPLSELAREELVHFEEVLRHLARRSIAYRRQRPSPYAGKLMAIVRPTEPLRMIDTLLACAFIEARSCERMKLLASHLEDGELKALYKSLLASEARHHRLFVDLALSTKVLAARAIDQRIEEIAAHEAAVIVDAPSEPRLHN
jgi:tRNA 2-(methylsulfanyl)-N6-isopentenyladenosine37 hydroxylase